MPLADARKLRRHTRSRASTATTRRRWSCASPGRASSTASRRWRRATTRCRTCRASRRWRKGERRQRLRPERRLATRQEMRSFVCGQCHVEYYFKGGDEGGDLPLGQGAEGRADRELLRRGRSSPTATHAETGAAVLKAQHPEFEMWSQGIHARSGVSCADCHMPYMREGAIKVSDHQVRSPLLNVARACQTCHRFPEDGDPRAGRGDPGPHQGAAWTGPRTPLVAADRRDQGGEEAGVTEERSTRLASSSARRSGGSTSSTPRTRWASTPRRRRRGSWARRSTTPVRDRSAR